MHVTFAERLKDNPDVLLSLPDSNPDDYFAGYPNHYEPIPTIPMAVVTPPPTEQLTATPDEALDIHPLVLPEQPAETDHLIEELTNSYLHEDLLPVVGQRPPKKPVVSDYGTRSKSAKLVALQKHAAMAVKLSQPNRISYEAAVAEPIIRSSMRHTIQSYFRAGAWKVVPRLPSDFDINTRWVHKPQYGGPMQTSSVPIRMIGCKSRITPQGFRFRPGVDYDPTEVSAETPHMQTIMIGLALEVNLNLHVIHADADNCFNAYSKLPDNTRITLKTPRGMQLPPGQTLMLVNAIQGSPQAGRLWQNLANEFLLKQLGFSQSIMDPCYYWKRDEKGFAQIIRLVDDFRIDTEDLATTEGIYDQLAAKWKFNRQINKPWCGMHIIHDHLAGTLTISMKQELELMLERFGMQQCTPISTPAAPGSKLVKPLQPILDSPFDYRGAVGCLLWFGRTGRPEVMYAVNQVS
jgi:hypothetical protein